MCDTWCQVRGLRTKHAIHQARIHEQKARVATAAAACFMNVCAWLYEYEYQRGRSGGFSLEDLGLSQLEIFGQQRKASTVRHIGSKYMHYALCPHHSPRRAVDRASNRLWDRGG